LPEVGDFAIVNPSGSVQYMRKEKSEYLMKVIYYVTSAIQGILIWCFIL